MKLEPDNCMPRCECGEYLVSIHRWAEGIGRYFEWRCPKCRKESTPFHQKRYAISDRKEVIQMAGIPSKGVVGYPHPKSGNTGKKGGANKGPKK